ncbi:unnamed protein product, partial [Rotaria sp. Silwood1]
AIPFEPVMVCCLGLTIDISRYISHLLQNIYDQATRSTTFFKASNVVHALENYATEVRLQSNTLFAAVHVNDLCTLIPHEQLTEPLQHFLYDYVPYGQVQGLTVDTIIDQLRTIINHDNDIEPRGLSFISNHTLLMYSTLIQACLMRAALIRSKVSDFHNKRRDVQIVFLNNGYSMNFIKEHAEQLFQDFHISNWKSNLNQNTYDKMREEIIEYDQQHQE